MDLLVKKALRRAGWLLILAFASCTPVPRELPARVPLLEGRLVEHLDVPPYTFLRVAAPDGEVWIGLPIGRFPREAVVRVRDAVLVRNHRLPALGRTLDAVYFGRVVAE